jgi:hypothetical protein
MATIGSAAHIKLKGFDKEGIDSRSPLEDQTVLTYKAARHYAQVNGFERYVHRGVPGVKGPMVMKRITDTLFEDEPDKDERSKINGLVLQVLRKTDAAVCVKRPADGDRETVPEWFIADKMPSNITIVALNHKNREPIPQAKPLVPTRTEQRLTAHEAGEDREPSEVTVKQGEPKTKQEIPQATLDAFKERHEQLAREHRSFVERCFEVVRDHQPFSALDVRTVLQAEGLTSEDSSAVRGALRELEDAGRVVKRKEEDSERLVRGGGSMPKGGRVHLYGLAPGPVPLRTAMPAGAKVYRAAQDWDNDRRQQVDAYADKILDALNRKVERGGQRPRSRGKLMDAAGLDPEQFDRGIAHLLKLELVYENNYCYFLTERRHDSTRKPVDVQPNAVQEQPPAVTVPTTPPAPPVPVHQDQLVTDLIAGIHALAQGSNADELEQLGRQNAALRAAIAAMEE